MILLHLQHMWDFTLCSLQHKSRHDKTNKMAVRPAKTQISLGIRPVWSESSLSARRNLGPLTCYWAHSEDSDQTERMPRLIWVFAGCTLILLFLSCRGSNNESINLLKLNSQGNTASLLRNAKIKLMLYKDFPHDNRNAKMKFKILQNTFLSWCFPMFGIRWCHNFWLDWQHWHFLVHFLRCWGWGFR